VSRITLGQLIRDLPHVIFHVDKGFLYNVSHLLRRPGSAIIEYLEGKRRPFFHPASFLVISLVLNYLIVKILDLHFYFDHELALMKPLEAKAIKDYDAMQWWFLEHTYIYILLAIPVSTLFIFSIMKLMKQPYNVAESAVIILFTIAQGVLIQSSFYLGFGWIQSGPFLRTLESINMSVLILYASWVIYQLLVFTNNKILRSFMALIAGVGLAAMWIASAYALYLVMS
jgi:hypothetical protein